MAPAGGGIDEISRALGSLESQAAAAREDRRELASNVERVDGKLDELKEQFSDVISEIRRGVLVVPTLEQRVGVLESQSEEFKLIKQRVIGAAILWAALTGIGTFVLANWKMVSGWFKGAS